MKEEEEEKEVGPWEDIDITDGIDELEEDEEELIPRYQMLQIRPRPP